MVSTPHFMLNNVGSYCPNALSMGKVASKLLRFIAAATITCTPTP